MKSGTEECASGISVFVFNKQFQQPFYVKITYAFCMCPKCNTLNIYWNMKNSEQKLHKKMKCTAHEECNFPTSLTDCTRGEREGEKKGHSSPCNLP
jgi:hypothetical protein